MGLASRPRSLDHSRPGPGGEGNPGRAEPSATRPPAIRPEGPAEGVPILDRDRTRALDHDNRDAPGIRVRPESPADFAAIRRLLLDAFGGPDEANLVEQLRAAGRATVALVAVADAAGVVGHILFSELKPATGDGPPVAALAPLAVMPGYQRRGIGGQLVEAGLAACSAAGIGSAVVLGHPAYYPRFGFRPAEEFGLICPFPASPGAFRAIELRPGALRGRAGLVTYAPEFGAFAE